VTTGISLYNDFQGLARLRADAAQSSPDSAREAARQFEALFVQMMLKSMRDAGSAYGEQRDRTYDEMFDQQIALEMTRGRGLGLADMLVQQLRLSTPEGAGTDGAAAGPATGVPAGPAPAGAAATRPVAATSTPATPAEFVRELWPHAERAGRELGVDPRAIVAQAALETGWGSRQIRDEAGRSANNLFGIKADSRWEGRRVGVNTLEYEGGLPAPVRAQFRAYDSLAEGVGDYVRFLKDNPRYRAALEAGGDAGAYAGELQAAGYATDPRYADKIRSILASPALDAAVRTLKFAGGVPTTQANRG
jgi:flagellar protein FlgJ